MTLTYEVFTKLTCLPIHFYGTKMPINHKQHVKIFTKFTALVSYSFGPGMQIGDLDRHKNWDYQFALQYHSMVLVTQLAEQWFAKPDVYSLNPSTFKSLNIGSVK